MEDQAAMPQAEQPADDFNTFDKVPTFIVTIQDLKVRIERPSFRKDRRVAKELTSLFTQLVKDPTLLEAEENQTREQQQQGMLRIATVLFEHAPERMLKAAAIVMEGSPDIPKPGQGASPTYYEDWVDENLDMRGVMRVLFPFLHGRLSDIGEIFARTFPQQIATLLSPSTKSLQ